MIDVSLPIDLHHQDATTFLQQIQGNIIKGHGRDFTAHLLLAMTGNPVSVRKCISQYTADHVTSAALAQRNTRTWRTTAGSGEPFGMFLLAPDGYRYLGFADTDLPVPTDAFNPPWGAQYFLRGMKQQSTVEQRRYNDPPVTEWEAPYQKPIHAMVLLADDDKSRLDQNVADISASLHGVFTLLIVERGRAIRAVFPRGELVIEHFGFQDGVSQPLMITQDIDREIAERGNTHWDPSAPLSLALVQEPGQGGDFGSFMVFRKLEQNVKAFQGALEQLAQRSGMTVENVGALAVGRFRDGTPALPTTTIEPTADPNDFHYDQDAQGAQCPFHAHIRKTNPRGDVPRIIGAPAAFERARRIVRRGITYGERPDLDTPGAATPPSEGAGLLFMCFQSNLDQFVIQQEGADSNDFVSGGLGVDAVLGQNAAPVDQTWPSTGTVKFTMANFVKMRGGEYFFAPSIPFLRRLGEDASVMPSA